MPESLEISVPFRWDLIAPDQLGSMLAGTTEVDLWFVDELVRCAGKVLARSGDGDLYFVGRSLDSMFDLLSAAMSGVDGAPLLCRGTDSVLMTSARRVGTISVWPSVRPSTRRSTSGSAR